MGLTVKVQGVDKLITAFSKIPAIARKNMRVAMKDALIDVENYSASHHRYTAHTGHADSAYKITSERDGMSATLELDPSKKAPYINILHEGSKPHKIYPKNKKALVWVDKGFAVATKGMKGIKGLKKMSMSFAKFVNHPGTKADDFLYRAFEVKKPDIMMALEGAMVKTIKEAGY
jgi:hypothetical protein